MSTTNTDTPLGGKWQIGAEALLDLYKRIDNAPFGLTKVALADHLNVARTTLDRYLNHRAELEPMARQALAARRVALAAPTTDSPGR